MKLREDQEGNWPLIAVGGIVAVAVILLAGILVGELRLGAVGECSAFGKITTSMGDPLPVQATVRLERWVASEGGAGHWDLEDSALVGLDSTYRVSTTCGGHLRLLVSADGFYPTIRTLSWNVQGPLSQEINLQIVRFDP